MSEYVVDTGKVKLWPESFGNPKNPAITLMMGNSSQGIMWTDEFCRQLASDSFFVVRFDYRDTGLSSCIDYAVKPYDLFDLVQDVLAILDAYQLERSHFVGLSMGGALALLLAVYHSDRVLTITTMMSSPDLSIKNNAFMGKDVTLTTLPPPKKEFIEAVIKLGQSKPATREEKITFLVENWRLANGNKAPFDEEFWCSLVETSLRREEMNTEAQDLKVANHSNHFKAQSATLEPNLALLKSIKVPTLVIQGKEDPIFPPAHAEAIAKLVSNGKLLLIKDMGHALNPVFFEEIINAIHSHIK